MLKFSTGTFLGKNTFETSLGNFVISSNLYPEGLKSPWHYHENSYFALIQKGGSVERRKTGAFECRPAMLLFYNFEEVHCNENYQSNSHNFNVEIRDQWYKKYEIDKTKLGGTLNIENPVIKALFTKIYKEVAIDDEYTQLGVEGLMLQLFAELLRNHCTDKVKAPSWVTKIKELIAYEGPNLLTLDYLSFQLDLHPVTISKEFFAHFGCSFSQYIRTVKCDRALMLLSKRHLSIESIAWETGFSDASHMAKIFREIYGFLPSTYRKKLG